jgi:hypothetical protein
VALHDLDGGSTLNPDADDVEEQESEESLPVMSLVPPPAPSKSKSKKPAVVDPEVAELDRIFGVETIILPDIVVLPSGSDPTVPPAPARPKPPKAAPGPAAAQRRRP